MFDLELNTPFLGNIMVNMAKSKKGVMPPQLKNWVYRGKKKNKSKSKGNPTNKLPNQGIRRLKNPLMKAISPLISLGTTIQQMTEEDVKVAGESGYWDTLDSTGKIKFILGKMSIRMSGIRLFKEAGGAPGEGPVINPAGMLNKWTGVGIGTWIASKIPGAPYKAWLARIGKGTLAGGLIGGFFDQPKNGNSRQAIGQTVLEVQQGQQRRGSYF